MSLSMESGVIAKDELFKGRRLWVHGGWMDEIPNANGYIIAGESWFQVSPTIWNNAIFNGRYKRIKAFVFSNTRTAISTFSTSINGSNVVALTIPAGGTGVFDVTEINREFLTGNSLGIFMSNAGGTGTIEFVLDFELEFDLPALNDNEGSIFVYGYSEDSISLGNALHGFPCCPMGAGSTQFGQTSRWKAPFDGEVLKVNAFVSNVNVSNNSELRCKINGVSEFLFIIPPSTPKTYYNNDVNIPFLKGDTIDFDVNMRVNGSTGQLIALYRFDPL